MCLWLYAYFTRITLQNTELLVKHTKWKHIIVCMHNCQKRNVPKNHISCSNKVCFYQRQTKFGARLCFHRRVSFLLSTGRRGLASYHASQVTSRVSACRGSESRGLPPVAREGVCIEEGDLHTGVPS